MAAWEVGEVRPIAIAALGEHYRRYRWSDPAAEEAMARSLRRWGQLTPIIVCLREGQFEVLDGFKRRAVARSLPGWATLSARVVEADERTAKAAILGLNDRAAPLRELEEAWIVHALVREDGLSQVEVAALLSRHKSWVCRRLALVEKLAAGVQEEVRLGLVSAALARQLVALPACNQEALLAAMRRQGLTTPEGCAVAALLVGASPEQEQWLLSQPREALRQAAGIQRPARDPRLSPAGNWLAKHLGHVLDLVSRLENWLRHPGKYELKELDRELLRPQLVRLGRDTQALGELVDDALQEWGRR